MDNPFGYGPALGIAHANYSNADLFPTQWAQDALRLAMASVYFPAITPTQTELEAANGQTIVVPIEGIMNDTGWPALTVGTSITVGSFNVNSVEVKVYEAGRGLSVDRFVAQYITSGMYPGRANSFLNQLAINYAMSWENVLRSTYLGGRFMIHSVAAGSYSGVNNNMSGTGATVLGTFRDQLVDAALEEFRSVHTGALGTFTIQPFDDGLFRMVGNWKTLKGIAKSADFKLLDIHTTSNGQRQIYQEIGPWNGFMFVRHDLMPDGTVLAHGRNVCAQAFGGRFEDDDIPPEDIVRLQDPVPFQVRYERNWKGDFYRAKAAAWYSVAGTGILFRDIGTHAIRIHAGV